MAGQGLLRFQDFDKKDLNGLIYKGEDEFKDTIFNTRQADLIRKIIGNILQGKVPYPQLSSKTMDPDHLLPFEDLDQRTKKK